MEPEMWEAYNEAVETAKREGGATFRFIAHGYFGTSGQVDGTEYSGAGRIIYLHDPYNDGELMEVEEALYSALNRARRHAFVRRGRSYTAGMQADYYEVENF